MSTYHDLYITTPHIQRRSIGSLPYELMITCTRAGGWELWRMNVHGISDELLAGEYAHPDQWLVLDVAGHVIVDSRGRPPLEEQPEVAASAPKVHSDLTGPKKRPHRAKK